MDRTVFLRPKMKPSLVYRAAEVFTNSLLQGKISINNCLQSSESALISEKISANESSDVMTSTSNLHRRSFANKVLRKMASEPSFHKEYTFMESGNLSRLDLFHIRHFIQTKSVQFLISFKFMNICSAFRNMSAK